MSEPGPWEWRVIWSGVVRLDGTDDGAWLDGLAGALAGELEAEAAKLEAEAAKLEGNTSRLPLETGSSSEDGA